MSEETILVKLEDFRLICLAARHAVYHSTDLSNEHRGRWLSEEFENYTGITKEMLVLLLDKFNEPLETYREQQFQKEQSVREGLDSNAL